MMHLYHTPSITKSLGRTWKKGRKNVRARGRGWCDAASTNNAAITLQKVLFILLEKREEEKRDRKRARADHTRVKVREFSRAGSFLLPRVLGNQIQVARPLWEVLYSLSRLTGPTVLFLSQGLIYHNPAFNSVAEGDLNS